jgi:radical SAM protein with 4Fe4S-binding SPASM domain
MMKTHATMDELERFYDEWLAKTRSAVLAGPSDYAGQWPDVSVMDMAPPGRSACRRIRRRAMVLADGAVTVCDQDFRGAHAIGNVASESLASLWTGAAMERVRETHARGSYDGMPLCPRCREWHRP